MPASAPVPVFVQSALHPAGPVAQAISEMAWLLIAGGGAVFAGVMLALWWAVRRKGRRDPDGAGGTRTGRWWIYGGGVAFPLAVLLALLVYTAVRTGALTPPRTAGEPVVTVTGHMWWWEVHYRDPSRGIDFRTANEIRLPAGRAVTLGLTTADVIHSFWVPALAGKVDMVPGRVHQLRVQADRPGALGTPAVWRGQCAEFCGAQHALMALQVVVQTPADHERWLLAQQQPAADIPGAAAGTAIAGAALLQRGRQVFADQRCNACHAVRGSGSSPAAAAPDLTHVGSRLSIGAGTLAMGASLNPSDAAVSRAALRRWIVDPQQVKPGVRMPSYGRLDNASLDALVAYLEHLQ